MITVNWIKSLYAATAAFCVLSSTFGEEPVRYQTIEGANCNSFLSYLNKFMDYPYNPDDSVSRIRIDSSDYQVSLPRVGTISPTTFDFDNDGEQDWVFAYDSWGSYLKGTLLFITPAPKDKKESHMSLDLSDISVFPCQFDSSQPSSNMCPPFSQGAGEAGILFPAREENIFFRGRYVDIHVLEYKKDTYLLLRAMSEGIKDYAAIVKPEINYGYEPVCLFKR